MDRNLIAVQSSERWRPVFQTENDDHFESESRRIKALSPQSVTKKQGFMINC
jgi:hypothetical protein